MHHAFIDRYSNLKSPVHRLDARIKIILAFLAITLVVITPKVSFLPYYIYFAVVIFLWFLSHLPLKHLFERLALTLPFITVIGIGIAFGHNTQNEPLWHSFLFILLRAIIAIILLTLLTSTTPFPLLLEGLRWFRIPNVILSLLSFIYRFIYIIIDEFQRLNIGRKSRESGEHFKLSWKGRAWMIATFLMRSIERSERVYQAMLSRGYTGTK